jgi:hypothetical protein
MKETIICAAIWYKMQPKAHLLPVNVDCGVVICGHRHGHCIYTMLALTKLRTVTNGENAVGEHEQGFLTSKNRFVDRREAREIALLSGQVELDAVQNKHELYSEDIY